MTARPRPASRLARLVASALVLAFTLQGCGSWRLARHGALEAPTVFGGPALVIAEGEAWELELARVEESVVVGRVLRRWSIPPGSTHRWYDDDLSPDVTAYLNHWAPLPAGGEVAIERERVQHLVFHQDAGNLVGAMVAAGLLQLVILVTGGLAVSGGRID